MKVVLLLGLLMALPYTAFSNVKYSYDLNPESTQDYSAYRNIEVVVVSPLEACGPCKFIEAIARLSQDDGIFDAKTFIGRIFNYEVDFSTANIGRSEAKELGIKGYPTTIFFKDGKYQGHVAGAISLKQLGRSLDHFLGKSKYEKKAKNYLYE